MYPGVRMDDAHSEHFESVNTRSAAPPMPGSAEYEAHLKEELEHFAQLYEDPEAKASLFYKVPETWFELERRAGILISEGSGADMTGHVVRRLNSRSGVRMLSLGSGPGGV